MSSTLLPSRWPLPDTWTGYKVAAGPNSSNHAADFSRLQLSGCVVRQTNGAVPKWENCSRDAKMLSSAAMRGNTIFPQIAIQSWKETAMRKTLLVVCALSLVTVVAASTSASNTQAVTSSPVIRTYLLPDLSLKSVISPDLVPASAKPAPERVTTTAAGPPKRGFCRCSCGYPCSSSADCGGVSCDPFITCCDKSPRDKDAEWFYQSVNNSSHKTALPEEVLKKANCK